MSRAKSVEGGVARSTGLARWLSVLALGFVAGAATVMLADPSGTETRVFVNSDASAVGHVHAESDIRASASPRADG